MTIVLEARAEQRETENNKLKENFKDKLPEVDYNAFRAKIETEGLPEAKPQSDAAYEKFRMDYLVAKSKEPQQEA